MATRSEETFLLASIGRGRHVYKFVWTPRLGEHLPVRPETSGERPRQVRYTLFRRAIGHVVVPRQLSRTVWHFFNNVNNNKKFAMSKALDIEIKEKTKGQYQLVELSGNKKEGYAEKGLFQNFTIGIDAH